MGSSRALTTLRTLQKASSSLPLSTLIRSIPKFGRLLVYLLFLLNFRSWPLVWHYRLFDVVIAYHIRHTFLRFRMLFMSPSAGLKFQDDWLDTLCPVGENPFEMVVPYRSWASIDDADFNGHLSNSSYSKVLDFARMKSAAQMFPMFFRAGGWTPLAATHIHFLHEIPIFKSYEIRVSLAAWDHKWLYVMSKFVTKRAGGKKKKDQGQKSSSLPIRQIGGLGTGESANTSVHATPANKTPILKNVGPADTELSLHAVAVQLSGEEPDGATLHTIQITQICYKIGRITVPPGLVLAANGFTGFPGHSLANPHPQWAQAKRVMSRPMGGSPKKLRELMTGGWKNVPETERWWDQALGSAVEERRVKNLASMECLRNGMDGARTL